MAKTLRKTSISECKENQSVSKFSVSYVRVSSAKQTEIDKTGITRQEKAYKKWLLHHPEYRNFDGIEFKDLGVSGRKNVKQGALGLFLKKAEKGEIPPNTCLVVESMSRLTRDVPIEGIKLLIRIWELGHNIAFTQGNWKGEILSGRDNGVIQKVAGALEAASYEWEDKQARVLEYHTECLERLENDDLSFYVSRKGRSGRMYPFWLDFDEDINVFKKIPEKVKLVQRIFKMAETMGAKKIHHILKKEEINNPANGKTKYLSPTTIRDLLKNRSVLGELTKRNITFYDKYPSIITPEQFDAVQSSINTRRTFMGNPVANSKLINLFQGINFCGQCGGRIDVVNRKRDACINKGEKNGLKYEVSIRQMYCHHGRNKTSDCKVHNSAPYKYEHSDIDNELTILYKILDFHWAKFFTDEKHEADLKVQIARRDMFLDERNSLKNQIAKYDRAEEKYIEEGEILPRYLREKRTVTMEQFMKKNTQYRRAKNDIQNLKRKKTGKQLEEDIQKRVEHFIKHERFDCVKRSKFNMFLKEQGIAIEVHIGKNQHKFPDNYRFDVGIGMYDFITGEYKGLDQSLESGFAFGMDLKQVEEDMQKRKRHYKKLCDEECRDIRFPKAKRQIEMKPLTFESELGKEIMANKKFLKTLLVKKLVESMKKNAIK